MQLSYIALIGHDWLSFRPCLVQCSSDSVETDLLCNMHFRPKLRLAKANTGDSQVQE